MDNCFTGQRDQSRQTTEKAVLYIIPAGPVTECAFARWRSVLLSSLDILTSSHLFLLSNPVKTASKLIAWSVGRVLPVHWIGY